MGKKKKLESVVEKYKPLPFAELDICRKSIEWHLKEASDLFDQLEHEGRGMIAGTNEKGSTVFMFFKGSADDCFKVKEFLEGLYEK